MYLASTRLSHSQKEHKHKEKRQKDPEEFYGWPACEEKHRDRPEGTKKTKFQTYPLQETRLLMAVRSAPSHRSSGSLGSSAWTRTQLL
jgi:hypothetical protein